MSDSEERRTMMTEEAIFVITDLLGYSGPLGVEVFHLADDTLEARLCVDPDIAFQALQRAERGGQERRDELLDAARYLLAVHQLTGPAAVEAIGPAFTRLERAVRQQCATNAAECDT